MHIYINKCKIIDISYFQDISFHFHLYKHNQYKYYVDCRYMYKEKRIFDSLFPYKKCF